MRHPFLKIFALAAFGAGLIVSAGTANADQRYCAGSCNSYGEPVYDVPALPEDGLRYSPEYEDQHRVGSPVYRDEPRYRYDDGHRYNRYQRRSRYKKQRRYKTIKKRSHRRVYHDDWQGGQDYSNRTEFCREHFERRGNGWIKRKVKVRRCVWVRNDLLGQNRRDYRYSDDW